MGLDGQCCIFGELIVCVRTVQVPTGYGKKASLIKAGLALVKLLQPLYMRLADDNVATKAITEAVQNCLASALNGEVHVTLPEILTLHNCVCQTQHV